MTGAKTMAVTVPKFQKGTPKIELNYHYDTLEPIAGAAYKVTFVNGEVREGQLNDKGHATLLDPPDGDYIVQYGEDPREYVPEDDKEDKSYVQTSVQNQAVRDMRAQKGLK